MPIRESAAGVKLSETWLEAIVWREGPAALRLHGTHCRAQWRKGQERPRTSWPEKMLWLPEAISRFVLERVSSAAICRCTFGFKPPISVCSSKKGVSSNQLHRTLGVTLQTAWFMSHRLREAMRPGSLAPMAGVAAVLKQMKSSGRKDGTIKRRGHGHKNAVLSLIDRNSGQVRSFHVEGPSAGDIVPIMK